MQTSTRVLYVLVATVLATLLAIAPAQGATKPKHISMVEIETITPSEVDGFVQGAGPCDFRRPVVLLRQPFEGPSRAVERTTTLADGRFSFERDFGTQAIYQVLAPAVEKRRFVCRSATSRFFGFFN
ncbi:hypothetical protein HJD18_12345 [Thermoleophilia bacterium SCSIO 60948]|nr:hypothetical protein HJD18_12345 [Thermoleophilia bacterium SCSIO 60948]